MDNHRGALLSTAVMALACTTCSSSISERSAGHRAEGPAVDYYGLAAAAAASWIGVPGPGEPVLIAAGVLASRGKLDLATVLVVAWAAATAGGILGWAIGLKAGRGLLTGRGPLHGLRLRTVARGEKVFDRYAVVAVLLTPSWIAGIHRVRSTVYQPTNALGGRGLGGRDRPRQLSGGTGRHRRRRRLRDRDLGDPRRRDRGGRGGRSSRRRHRLRSRPQR